MTAFTARAGGIIGRAGRRTAGAPRTSVAVLVATRIDADAGLTVLPAPAFVLILAHGCGFPVPVALARRLGLCLGCKQRSEERRVGKESRGRGGRSRGTRRAARDRVGVHSSGRTEGCG